VCRVYTSIQEGEMAPYLRLHCELDVVEVDKDVIRLFRSMGPDNERNVTSVSGREAVMPCLRSPP
jgi:hypothetical protein